MQPDGKIVVAGATSLRQDALAVRLNANGSPDASFDGDGAQAVDSGGTEGARAVAVQPDGKIVLAGSTTVGMNAAVYRLTGTGALDPAFDLDGAAGIDSGGQELARGVTVEADGGIVVVGSTSVGQDAAVYRLTTAGALDPSFDLDGARGIDLGGIESAAAVAVQPDGMIVVAGVASAGNDDDVLVARFTPTGAPDAGFGGGDGVASVETGGDDIAQALVLQPDGKIVVAGWNEPGYDATVYRLTSAGALDGSFGAGGIVRLDSGNYEEAKALGLQADGKILVAGLTSAGYDGVVWRLRPDGGRDAGFGDDGKLVLGGGGLEEAEALALQADGKILLAGDNSASETDVLVYRLLGDGRAAGGPATAGGAGPNARSAARTRCAGKRATIVGTARADRIRGTRRSDVIAALGGNDVVRGLAGDDLVCAGPGDDLLDGGRGRDTLRGEAGRDRLVGGAGRDAARQ